MFGVNYSEYYILKASYNNHMQPILIKLKNISFMGI